MALFKLIHLLSVVLWVGGMFFAYMVLRFAAAEVLQPAQQLQLWDKVLGRFFSWIWLFAFLILVTGLYLIYLRGGVSHAPHFVQLMLLLGLSMMSVFGYLFFSPYVKFSLAVAAKDWSKAAAVMKVMQKLIVFNLLIGVSIMLIVLSK